MLAQFPVLVRTFLARVFESDAAGQATDLRASFFWLIAFLAMPGFLVPILIGLASFAPTPETWGWAMIAKYRGIDALRVFSLGDKTLYLCFTVIVSACLAAGVWRRLLPDPRDARVLGSLPVQPALVVLARLAAILIYVSIIAVAMHAMAAVSFGLALAAENTFGFAIRGIVAHFAASSAASLFVFLGVIGLQGLLLAIAGPRRFPRWSALLQLVVIGGIVASVLATPLISNAARDTVLGAGVQVRAWTLAAPQLWFLGVYESVLGTTNPMLARLAVTALVALGAAALVVTVTLPLTYWRLVVAVNERSDLPRVRRSAAIIARLVRMVGGPVRQQAVVQFLLSSLLRVERLRLVVIGAVACAIAWAVPAGFSIFTGAPGAPRIALLSVPVAALLFLLTGLRYAAGMSTDAGAAWMFDVLRVDTRDARAALDRAVWRLVVAPLIAVTMVVAAAWWGIVAALVHGAFLSGIGALAIAILFWRFEHVACTRAWNGEQLSARKWWPLGLVGFAAALGALPSVEYGLFFMPLAAPLIVGLLWGVASLVRRASDAAGSSDEVSAPDQIASALKGAREGDGGVFHRSGPIGARGTSGTDQPQSVENTSVPFWPPVPPVQLRIRPGALLGDLRYAGRRLARAPAFALFSVVTLAVGVGATTAAHSFMVATTVRPMEIRDAGRVMTITSQVSRSLSWPDFEDLRAQQTSFASVEAYSDFGTSLAGHDRATLVAAELVTGGYFDVLGVAPVVGRLLQATDDLPTSPPAAVLAEATWRRHFGADPSVIGRLVKIGGEGYTVVGVVPASFRGIQAGARQPALWTTFSHPPPTDRALTAFRDPTRRNRRYLHAIGRLVEGRTQVHARTELDLIGARLDREFPLATSGGAVTAPNQRRWTAGDLRDVGRRADTGRVRLTIVLLPVLVLLVACTNLANLSLSRGAGRRSEFAIRRALGASRWSLVREQLVEHGLIATVGGLTGILLANRLLAALVSAVEATLGYSPQYQIEPQLGLLTVLVATSAALLALVAAGLLPALRLTQEDPRAALASDAASTVVPLWRGRANLIALQVAVSVALLLVAALCVRQLMAQDPTEGPAFDIDRLAVLDVPFSVIDRAESRVRETIDRVLAEARQAAGVEIVAVASGLPGADFRAGYVATYDSTTPERPFVPGAKTQHVTVVRSVSPGFFPVTGIALRRGRLFDARDAAGVPDVGIVTERHAQTLFGTGDVVGRQILIRRTDGLVGPEVDTLTIVGVVADDVRTESVNESGVVYAPFAQRFEPDVLLLARAASGADVRGLVTALQTAAIRVNPDLAIRFAGPAVLFGGEALFVLRTVVQVATGLALVALVLSMTGLYGVLSHILLRRTREMGVRLALGAEPRHIHALVFADGFRPVGKGVLLGLAVAGIVRMSMRPLFVGPADAFDPVAVVLAVAPLLAGAAIACYLPSRRASRVDPNVALRQL